MSLFDIFKQRGKKSVTPKPARETAAAEERAREKEKTAPVRMKENAEKATSKEKKTPRAAQVAKVNIKDAAEGGEHYAPLIVSPLITEKASHMTADGAYAFAVREDATKNEVKKAMQEMYNVTPVLVNMVNMPLKRLRVRGKEGIRSRPKKAIVFLKEGDRIEFI